MKTIPLHLMLLALAAPPVAAPAALAADEAAPAKPAPEAPIPPAVPRTDGKIVCEWRDVQPKVVVDFLARKLGWSAVGAADAAPVTLVAKEPLAPMEALDALNGILADRGSIVLADPASRQLRLLSLADARAACQVVATGSDPAAIPADHMMRTQVIPLANLDAEKTLAALTKGGLVDAKRTAIGAVKDTNAVVVTDIGAGVRRLAMVLAELDKPAPVGENTFKVFRLRFASAQRVADAFKVLFQVNDANAAAQQNPWMRGRGGFFGGGPGGNGGGDKSQDESKPAAKTLLAADTTTNTVIVRADPAIIARMDALVKDMDVDGTASERVFVHRVHNGKAADLANALYQIFQGRSAGASATAARGGAGNVFGVQAASAPGQGDDHKFDSADIRVVAETTSNSVVIFCPERCFGDLQKVLQQLDEPKRQVFIRAVVAEIDIDDSLDVGVELTGFHRNTTSANGAPGSSNVTGNDTAFSNFNLFNQTTGITGYLIDNQHFQAALRAVQTCTRTDVLATPSILTMDNQEGKIVVGQQISILTGSTTTTTGANPVTTNTFAYQNVGITLDVTPQINDQGVILMKVDQEMSSVAPTASSASANGAPTLNNRSMVSNVVLKEGQTVILGGLTQHNASVVVSKVPLLGDIPWVGELFKRTTTDTSKTQLVVFLTPMLVEHPEDLQELSQHLRYDMTLLDDTIEPGLLQKHLEAMRVGGGKGSPAGDAPAPDLLKRDLDGLRHEATPPPAAK